MSNKERLIANNEKIAEIRKTLARKQVSPTDMLQEVVDQNNSCFGLFAYNLNSNLDVANKLDTSKVTDMRAMFSCCKFVTSLDLSKLDTSNVTLMGGGTNITINDLTISMPLGMFDNCASLKELNISNFDTSNVTSMQRMFYACKSLTSFDLSNFDTSNVTSMQSMFYGCENLTSFDLSNFNTSNVTDTGYMFNNCTGLTSLDVSSFDTSNVTVMSGMFYGCENLQTLNLFPLELKRGDKIDNMFQNCKNLTNIDLSNWTCTNWAGNSNIFMNCSSLVEIDLSPLKLENSKVFEGALAMFSGCTNLKKIKGVLNFYGQSYAYNTGAQNIFLNCVNLEEVTLMNIKQNLILGSGTSYGTKITNATLINTIQQLWDYSGTSTTKTLTLSTASKNNIANIYVKLITPTEEQIAQDTYINNKKPYIVCESTDDGAMTLTEYATSKNWSIA